MPLISAKPIKTFALMLPLMVSSLCVGQTKPTLATLKGSAWIDGPDLRPNPIAGMTIMLIRTDAQLPTAELKAWVDSARDSAKKSLEDLQPQLREAHKQAADINAKVQASGDETTRNLAGMAQIALKILDLKQESLQLKLDRCAASEKKIAPKMSPKDFAEVIKSVDITTVGIFRPRDSISVSDTKIDGSYVLSAEPGKYLLYAWKKGDELTVEWMVDLDLKGDMSRDLSNKNATQVIRPPKDEKD